MNQSIPLRMRDAIIVGGSYAGISAGLQLARARRDVLVLDVGERRNRTATASHGFLGQDGQDPAAIAAKGRTELLAYPTVTWQDALLTEARPVPGGFAVRVGGDEHLARRLVLAMGVVDELPAIPGLSERWGRTVFHCPYCHAYELGRGRLAVLATGPMSLHQTVLVSDWASAGATTLFLAGGGALELDPAQRDDLVARGIHVEHTRVVAVAGDGPWIDVRLEDGRELRFHGLFLQPRTRPAGALAESLGCALDDGPLGPFVRTDETKETTVRGVFACGDVARGMGSVAFAVGDGARAGMAAHQSLLFRPAE
jgi:thioredoxin reductase